MKKTFTFFVIFLMICLGINVQGAEDKEPVSFEQVSNLAESQKQPLFSPTQQTQEIKITQGVNYYIDKKGQIWPIQINGDKIIFAGKDYTKSDLNNWLASESITQLNQEVINYLKEGKKYTYENGKLSFETSTDTQDWTRFYEQGEFFQKYKTTIVLSREYDILAGTWSETTEEYVQKLKPDGKESNPDDWTQKVQVSKNSVELYQNKIVSKTNTDFDDKGNALGTSTTNYYEVQGTNYDRQLLNSLNAFFKPDILNFMTEEEKNNYYDYIDSYLNPDKLPDGPEKFASEQTKSHFEAAELLYQIDLQRVNELAAKYNIVLLPEPEEPILERNTMLEDIMSSEEIEQIMADYEKEHAEYEKEKKLYEQQLKRMQEKLKEMMLKVSEGGKETYFDTSGKEVTLAIFDSDGNIISGELYDLSDTKTLGQPVTDVGDGLSNWLNEKGITETERDRRYEKRQRYVDNYLASPFSFGNKWGVMDWARRFGYVVHAFNEYKGLASLTSFIKGLSSKDVAERKAKLQEEFCVIGGLQQCFTSIICDSDNFAGFKAKTDNYILAKSPTKGTSPIMALIVGEKSDPIKFRGETRQNLIDLFGDYTYVNGEKIDFTDGRLDISSLPIIMWLYNVQLTVNNPTQKEVKYNIQFKGKDRLANWFAEYQLLESGKKVNFEIPKYSTTNYTQACIIFDGRGIKKAQNELDNILFTDTAKDTTIKEFCSDLEPAGPASTVERKQQAAQTNQNILLTDGEGI